MCSEVSGKEVAQGGVQERTGGQVIEGLGAYNLDSRFYFKGKEKALEGFKQRS